MLPCSRLDKLAGNGRNSAPSEWGFQKFLGWLVGLPQGITGAAVVEIVIGASPDLPEAPSAGKY